MGLRGLTLSPVLATSTSDILRTFLVPCLTEAASFDRGVGFFTSSWLRLAGTGLTALAERKGRVRLIASPKLSADDWAALAQGAMAQQDMRLHASLSRTIQELGADLESEPVRALAWMVADGLLEIRLAVPANDLDGDFHDKFGIFVDDVGDRVAFHGSMNDSAQAFRNYEGLDVFTSWASEADAARVVAHHERFERLWSNADPHVRIFDLPDAIRNNLVEFTSGTERPYANPRPSASAVPSLWRHQDEALAAFLSARAGILEMATGTGKTRTAIRILRELQDRRQIDFAIVCAGGVDLLDQWRAQLSRDTSSPIYCTYGGTHDEMAYLTQTSDAVWIVSRDALPGLLGRIPPARRARTLLICDEVHGFGAPTLVASLTGIVRTFGYRLGLSATPDREYDDDGNHFIEEEIGPTIFRFSLEDAIRRGILCEFDYVALPYIFLDEDKSKVKAAIASYHARKKAGQHVPLEQLWLAISRVAKEAPNKLPVFRAYLAQSPTILSRALIFVETIEYGGLVQPIILEKTRDFHTYYGADDQVHLQRFARGDLKVLLTAHRLSEGIDIRAVNTVILFSASRARLETIQRLGRCLRIDPADPGKRALVVDFVRADLEDRPDGNEPHPDYSRAAWLTELSAIRRDSLPSPDV